MSTSTSRASNAVTECLTSQPQWLILAVASGACAAFNGVFAKLTTTALTTSIAASLASFLHLSPTITEPPLRLTFFILNLIFNGIMWSLFTAALTRASSTTRVSVINTAANFIVTAAAGAAVFGEKVGGVWWVGVALLGAGSIVIGAAGKKEEGESANAGAGEGAVDAAGVGGAAESEGLLATTGEDREEGEEEEEAELRTLDEDGTTRRREEEDLLDLR